MALVAPNVLRHGRSAGFATSAGICTGTIGWAVAAGLGVSTAAHARWLTGTILVGLGARVALERT